MIQRAERQIQEPEVQGSMLTGVTFFAGIFFSHREAFNSNITITANFG